MSDDNNIETVTVNTSTPDPVETKKFKPLTDDPYDYTACIISIAINYMPEDDDPSGRQMVIAVRNHLDQPIMRFYREAEMPLEQLPEELGNMLDMLREDMPNRKMAMLEEKANKKKKKSPTVPTTPTPAPEGKVISTSTPYEITKTGAKKPINADAGQQSLF
jgi:hypothetical protein